MLGDPMPLPRTSGKVFMWSEQFCVLWLFLLSLFFLELKQIFDAQNKETMDMLSSLDDYYDDDMKNVITIEYNMKMKTNELF